MPRKTPFHKVLVANRGEVAVRVIRTAKALGYKTVAVYSDVDAAAPHVTAADEAARIGGDAPADSYLRISHIIAAACATGADAIHPGYGFLAENSELVDACTAAGVVFIGPSAFAMRAMGDKARAKELIAAAGVPCVPGYQGADQSPTRLATEASIVGFPLMIKATAGGGGRGMRLVKASEDFPDALRSAKSEAKSAFGDDTVLLERAIVNPRHVEIQIMADREGYAIHLGERDCSVQRRHQKLIEEAPSPAVSGDLRARMGAAAIAAVKAIGYEGAGTLEFLLDSAGHFYFMEMNTRLQVEHPVTEAITGLDLVALQLRVAAGEPLGIVQDEIEFQGHAIEVRLCAEDPAADFLPQSGRMEVWRPATHLRVEHALSDGVLIPQFYDSMVAKLIAHGATREDARRRLITGLETTVALGVRTNQTFLQKALRHPEFCAGNVTTAFIERNRDSLLPDISTAEAQAALHTAALLRAPPAAAFAHGFTAPLRLARGAAIHEVLARADRNGKALAESAAGKLELTVLERAGDRIDYLLNELRSTSWLRTIGTRVLAHLDGQPWDFEDRSLMPIASATARSEMRVRASMTGRIVTVEVAEGELVKAGQKVLVLEAMKMEHTHRAEVDGIVSAVHVRAGDQVTAQRILVEIEPA